MSGSPLLSPVPAKTPTLATSAPPAPAAAFIQGLTLVHFSAQREHILPHVLGCFAEFSDQNGSG